MASAHQIAHLTKLLGRAPRSYAAFAKDAAAQWAKRWRQGRTPIEETIHKE